ncbi:MAG: imidazole glycerol phosphate synthase subunit HisH [Clostridia bacterium]|nr:imidazole glycerol phosphate synthase subunit HisH [Clostridia bacterium]
MIAIIDYDAGNVKNVQKALEYLGFECSLTDDAGIISAADKIVLPGVGNFGDCMEKLRARRLDELICELVNKGRPFVGICLGMQLLYESSEESPGVKGLGLLKGSVKRFPETGLKIPHIGFNSIMPTEGCTAFDGLGADPFYYFVHSYYCDTEDRSAVAARAVYGIEFDCAVQRDNIFASQFHPEKSGVTGLKTLENVLR